MTTLAHEPADLPRIRTLWFGLLGGALAWKLQLMVNYALVPYACWRELTILVHLASLATLLLALGAAAVSLRSWRSAGSSFELELGGPIGRSRFMALLGVVLSVYFALVILGQWVPNLLLSPCDGLS